MPATKPAPDVYLAAAAVLGVPPARRLVVEDTVTGVEGYRRRHRGLQPRRRGHGSPEALHAGERSG